MIKKVLYLTLVVMSFALSPLAFADAQGDLNSTYDDTATFDGGDGSTINCNPSAGDSE
ncbi:MAG: hypothetical protein PHW46_01050 [Candidatus Omnitrophica bacterium]|nr:hypothetical protein [Candidatus Omnitrophota bacterium]